MIVDMLGLEMMTGVSQDKVIRSTHKIDEVLRTGRTGTSATAAWVWVDVNQLAGPTRKTTSRICHTVIKCEGIMFSQDKTIRKCLNRLLLMSTRHGLLSYTKEKSVKQFIFEHSLSLTAYKSSLMFCS